MAEPAFRAARFSAALAAMLPVALTLATGSAGAQQVVRLYPGPAPGSERWTWPEVARRSPAGGTVYFNVRDPEFTAYLPPAGSASGAGVILLPGGALRLLNVDADMMGIVRRLNAEGVAVFILKYRILQGTPPPESASPPGPNHEPAGAPAFPHLDVRHANANPSPNDPALAEVLRFAIADARRMLANVRRDAARWRLDPHRIGLIGASAGGGVAIGTVLSAEAEEEPSFVVSLFGPSLMDVSVPAAAPPLFLATQTQHGPVTDGLIALLSEWKDAGKPAELHVYDVPASEFPDALWIDRFVDWAKQKHLLSRSF